VITDSQKKSYIDETSRIISLMCRANQWNGLTEGAIQEWLRNFRDQEGLYFASKIIRKWLYYSEDDIISLLRFGLYDKIYAQELISEIIQDGNLMIPNYITSSIIKSKFKKTLFIPLLDSNKPHESGLQFSRYLVQKLKVESNQSLFHYDIQPNHLNEYDKLVIVDDCIGSGQQLVDFWLSPQLKNIREATQENKIKCYYLILIGYKNTIEDIIATIPKLKIIICVPLTDQYRVFSNESINRYWNDNEELEDARNYFLKLTQERGIPMYGFAGLDFAVIIHRNIPDWSLPIFWKGSSDWKFLIERKNSNV